MNLKQEKGYVGVDVSIAIIILIILIPTIMGILFNISSSARTSEIKEEALNIAVNLLETAKGTNMPELNEQNVITEYKNNQVIGTMEYNPGENTATITTNKGAYILTVDVADYSETHEGSSENVLKNVEVIVKYKVQNKEDAINIRTVVR